MTFMIWVPNPCWKLHPMMKVPIFIHHQTMAYLLLRRACLYILLKVCCLYLIMFAPLMVAFIPTVTPKIKKDTPRWILKFIYEPAAHCHQLKKNAVGNALASFDKCKMYILTMLLTCFMSICHPGAEWKGKGKQSLGLQLRIIHSLGAMVQSTLKGSLALWGRKHTQRPNDYRGRWDRKWIVPTTS